MIKLKQIPILLGLLCAVCIVGAAENFPRRSIYQRLYSKLFFIEGVIFSRQIYQNENYSKEIKELNKIYKTVSIVASGSLIEDLKRYMARVVKTLGNIYIREERSGKIDNDFIINYVQLYNEMMKDPEFEDIIRSDPDFPSPNDVRKKI